MDEDLGVPPWLRKHRKPPYPKYPKYPKPTIHGASAVGACFRRNSSWICDFGTASTGWQHLEKWQIYASNWCLFVNPTYLLRRGVKQGCMPSIRTVYHESYSGSENGLSPMLRQIQSNPYTEPSKYTWQVEKCHGKRENVGWLVKKTMGIRLPSEPTRYPRRIPHPSGSQKNTKTSRKHGFVQELDTPKSSKIPCFVPVGYLKIHRKFGYPMKIATSRQLRGIHFWTKPQLQPWTGSRGSVPGTGWERIRTQKISPEAPPGVAQSQTQVGDG